MTIGKCSCCGAKNVSLVQPVRKPSRKRSAALVCYECWESNMLGSGLKQGQTKYRLHLLGKLRWALRSR